MRQIKRDPAPSRVAYRWNRLWLRPGFRKLVRVALPIAIVTGLCIFWITQEDRIRRINDAVAEIRTNIETRPEFMVKLMAVEGASPDLATEIRNMLPVNLPVSSFDLNLEDMRRQVEALDAVARADMRVRAGGFLQIVIDERIPAVIWRGPEGLQLLDATGHRVVSLDYRRERPDLPLIVGEGAPRHITEALRLIANAGSISDRIYGLVRMGEMRWDIVMDRDQRILLPEIAPLPALDRILALNEAQELLARDITHIDFRNAKRPSLRLSRNAVQELRIMKGIQTREED